MILIGFAAVAILFIFLSVAAGFASNTSGQDHLLLFASTVTLLGILLAIIDKWYLNPG